MALHPRHAVSVCSGYGGIDLGLRLALDDNCRTVLYCEREAYAAAILVAHMENGLLDPAPVWSDLATLPVRETLGRLGVDPAGVIMHGGIPCQPWSVAGKGDGADDPRWLWPAFWCVAQAGQVGWIFLENVRGFVCGKPAGLDLVLRDLSRAGWDAEWDLFSAAECGAPHRRERLFLLAHAPGIGRMQGRPEWTRQQGDAASAGGGVVGDAECPLGRTSDRPGGHLAGQGGVSAGRDQASGRSTESGVALADAYWPSAPGEEQHGWEPPRVVVYPRRRRPQAQSGLGGGADGVAAGLDAGPGRVWAGRISALGNGVVPVAAGLAYLTLHWRLTEG